jgi:hypothetical protein
MFKKVIAAKRISVDFFVDSVHCAICISLYSVAIVAFSLLQLDPDSEMPVPL